MRILTKICVATGLAAIILWSSVGEVFATVSTTSRVDYSCMRGVVETRENAIIAAKQKEQASLNSALETRKIAISNAWTLSTRKEIKTAVIAAHKAYTLNSLSIKATSLRERTAAWRTYKTGAINCRVPAFTDMEPGVLQTNDLK